MIKDLSKSQSRVWAWFIVGVAFYIFPLVITTFSGLHMANGNMKSWLPDSSPAKDTFQEFAECFESYDSMLVSWEGASSDSYLFNKIATEIITRDRTHAYYTGEDPLISNIRTFSGFLDLFGKDRAEDPEFIEKAKVATAGFLTQKDTNRGVLSFETTAYGSENQARTFVMVDEIVRKMLPEGIEPKYTGPCFLTRCSNASMWNLFTKLYPFTTLVSFILAVLFLRTYKLAFIAFGISLFASTLLITVMYRTGRDLGDFLVLVPSLTQLLAMSNVIHLMNYYKESVEEFGCKDRAWKTAISHGWLPTTAASISTAVGLGALILSDIYLVREFAVFGIIGVLFSMLTVLCFTPPLLILVQPDVKSCFAIQNQLISGINQLVVKRKTMISIVLGSLLIFAGYGLKNLKSDATLNSLFRENAIYQTNADWFEKKMGSIYGSDYLVTFPYGVEVEKQFKVIDAIAKGIQALDPEYSVLSPAIFDQLLKDEPIETRWEKVEESKLAVKRKGKTYWRIMVRHPLDPDPNKSEFREKSDAAIARIVEDFGDFEYRQPEVELTGFTSLFLTTQSGLINQLLHSFLCAFVIITPLIMLFLRRFWIGLIAIIGNLFPLVVFFGILGWLNFRVDIATMMIATVAFGIAVDDTVHFLTWLSRGLERTKNLKEAISFALHHSAGAILQTTLIISSGMSLYLLSDFIPSVRFAVFSSIVLIIAVIGDLVLLPALILGVFNRFFKNSA